MAGTAEFSPFNQIQIPFRVLFQHSLCAVIIVVVSPVIFLNHFIHCPIGRGPLERCAEEEDVDGDQAEGEAAEETGISRMITWDDQRFR